MAHLGSEDVEVETVLLALHPASTAQCKAKGQLGTDGRGFGAVSHAAPPAQTLGVLAREKSGSLLFLWVLFMLLLFCYCFHFFMSVFVPFL